MTDRKKIAIFRKVDIFFICFFFVSFLHSMLGLLFCVALLYYLTYGVEGAVKILLLSTVRGILNPALSAGVGNNTVKLFILLFVSLVILFNKDKDRKVYDKSDDIIYMIIIFSTAVLVTSFVVSSYPTTAVFKVISFTLPFCAILKGVYTTRHMCRWTDYFSLFMTFLMVFSILVIPFPQFRTINEDFQGVFNHVNVMGVISALYIALVLNSRFFYENKIYKILALSGSLLCAFLSASRTGMISCIVVITVYYLFDSKSKWAKVFTIIIGVSFVSLIISASNGNTSNPLMQAIHEFIFKNDAEGILDSRAEIIEQSYARFKEHMLTGTGFMVPYDPSIRDLSLSFGLQVEPGNILAMLLGDTGIIGISLFTALILLIFMKGKKRKLYLLISALIANLGEMVFFSSNNYSILMYFLIALYLYDDCGSIDYKYYHRR